MAFLSLAACGSDGTSPPIGQPTPSPAPPAIVTLEFDFAAVGSEWTSGIAEFGDRARVNFETGVETVPPDLSTRTGLKLAGTNVTDDLAMFTWRRIINLEANRLYRIETRLELASNVPPGCIGAGGAPGESVFVKAGASASQPGVDAQQQLSVDKANQSQSGSEAVVIGDLAVPGAGTCSSGVFAAKTIEGAASDAPIVSSNANGELWLIVLSDSGFEARSEWYLLNARFTLTPQ
ncbi:hypothetical protein ACI5KX_04470 [Erythrobacter sp. GH1-10]|uniref:hypothetical protein n=1 Tax=Erythrobacter sp. GH1-10 TaxID=3349334 RepID=UPI0038779D9B